MLVWLGSRPLLGPGRHNPARYATPIRVWLRLTAFGTTIPTMASLLINIDVPDLERGIAFYTSAFELRLSRRFDSGFAELVGAEVPIYLLQSPAGTPPFRNANVQRDYTRHWTPLHLDLVVPDLEAALARAIAAGATQESTPSSHAYGSLVLLGDPFGHGVCLLQFNSQGYDAITDKTAVPG